MTTHDATEQAWKNGYLTAITDLEPLINIDKNLFKQIINELLERRGIINKCLDIATEM